MQVLCVPDVCVCMCAYCGRLEQFVLARFEEENGGDLLVATLCLLEVSARGLLESELLTLLGDDDNLMPVKLADHDGQEKGLYGPQLVRS